MTLSTPAGWYPDPEVAGGQRYFDGAAWTEHRVGPVPYSRPTFDGWGRPAWKGAQLGRPQLGPGALANPGRRLAARALDFLLLLPVFGLLLGVSLAVAAPHFGPIFPNNQYDTGSQPPPGIIWVYLDLVACVVTTGLVLVAYETILTIQHGRTVGKAWMHIRPLRIDGTPLNPGRAFGRVALYWLSIFFGWLGMLDPGWCLWDPIQQCLHDKIAGTIVVNDGAPSGVQVPSATTTGAWGSPPAQWPPAQWPPAQWPPGQEQWPQPQWQPPYGPPPQWPQPQWPQPQWPQQQPTPPRAAPWEPPTDPPPPPPHIEPPSGDPA